MDMSKADLTQTQGSQSRIRRRSASSERSRTQRGPVTTIHEAEIMKTKRRIGRYLFEKGVDINFVDQHTIRRTIPFVSELKTSEIPTREELKGWILEDALEEIHADVDDVKKTWVHTGCSILLDGWIDADDRHLVNVLVDCPKGTVYLYSSDVTDYMQDMDAMMAFLSRVVTVVGYENVVQVITNSTSAFMMEAGKLLVEKFPSLFWAVSASDCMQLMLERMEIMDVVKDTLAKARKITRFIRSNPNVLKSFKDETNGKDFTNPSKIRSIQPYLTLEDLVLEKDALIRILSNSSTLSNQGRRVADLVGDWSFWGDASTVLKGVFPLVRVMEWLYGGNREQIGFIYETMDQAKETIKQGFRNRESDYKPFWNVIDDVWNEFLHTPLHAAGYFLNPTLFYSEDFVIDPEVATGLFACLIRSTRDPLVQLKLHPQLESYRTAEGAFHLGSTIERRTNISPALWWSTYGEECRHLQTLAVRILSQTCDGASKFRLTRIAVEMVQNMRGDRTEQQRLADNVFLYYNLQLQKFNSGEGRSQ